MRGFNEYKIDLGSGLKTFLKYSGIKIESVTALEGPDNIIKLPDLTTFNWKARDGVVRVNCKEPAKSVIEQKTNLSHIDNGSGDPTRPYSFIIERFSDLIDVIYALKTIKGNKD